MKRIMGILLVIAVFGILISSVAAEELKAHDFGDFTLDVPGDKWQWFNAPYEGYSNKNGCSVAYFTSEDVNGESFEDNLDSLFNNYETMDDAEGLRIYQSKSGNEYVVCKYSADELYIIKDKDLNEAKAIADSAKLKSPNTSDKDKNKLVTESDAFEGLFKLDIPQICEFDKINEEGNDSYSIVSFKDNKKDIAINYIETDNLNDTKEYVSQLADMNDGNMTTEGNLTIVETVYGENSVYVFSDDKAIEIASSKADLDTLKEMAKSVEFED